MDNSKSRIIIALTLNVVMLIFGTYQAIHWFGVSTLRFGMLTFSSIIFLVFVVILTKRFIKFGYHKGSSNAPL